MKLQQSFLLLLATSLCFGQKDKSNEAALFLDAVFISANTMKYMDPDKIESINIIKNDTIINSLSYSGQIKIISKNPQSYLFLTLKQIKSKFTKIKSDNVIYMVNGELIKDTIDSFKLDQNYILEVEVTNSEEFYNLRKSDIKFDIINILGKTKENLDAKNKILLRG